MTWDTEGPIMAERILELAKIAGERASYAEAQGEQEAAAEARYFMRMLKLIHAGDAPVDIAITIRDMRWAN